MVEDDGAGIQEDILRHIFEPFFSRRVHDANTGAGLGLAISQANIQRHGGHIAVSSTPGVGTRFTVSLTRSRQDHPIMSSILLIEDDKVLSGVIAECLSHSDQHKVHTALNWQDARRLLDREEIQLILTDVQLPDANGLELLPHLASDYAVIVITAFGSINDAVRAMKTGASEYLVKPVNLDELVLVVNRVLESAGAAARPPILPPPASAAAPAPGWWAKAKR